MKPEIRWGRVLIAALLSELAVVVALMTLTGIYILFSHKGSVSDLQQFGQRAGYYVAPPAAGIAVFVSALWATRGLAANFILNAMLVGIVAVVLTAGMVIGARPEDRIMYIVSFVIRIIAGYLAGLAAQSRFNRTASQAGSPS